MTIVRRLPIDENTFVYVEVDDSATVADLPVAQSKGLDDITYRGSRGLADGAEFTTSVDDLVIGGKLFKESMVNMAKTVNDGLQTLKPDEWSVELHYGFKGKAAIPVILSGENQGGIKVTATWKKSADTDS